MRIAIFRNDLSVVDPEGYNSQEIGLARGLATYGHSVDVLTAAAPGAARHVRSIHGDRVRIIYLPYRKLPVIEAPIFLAVGGELDAMDYDLVQINDEGSVASFMMARACQYRRIPWIVYQGMYQLLLGRARQLFEIVHAHTMRPWIRRHAKVVLAKTKAARLFLQTRGYEEVAVLRVGVDLANFDNPAEIDWHERLSIDQGTRVLLYVGALEPRRRPDLLLDIVGRLGAGYRLVIVGDGPEQARIERRVRDERRSDVDFVGRLTQNELPSLYQQADCFLLPTEFEIYGMVVLEALSFGVPVVASVSAGPDDIIDDPLLGTTVRGFSVDDWCAAIGGVLSCQDDPRLSENRANHARSHYAWDAIALDYLEAVEAGFSSVTNTSSDT